MFNEILHDLNRKLSKQDVHLFDSFNFDDKESRDKLRQYVNVAVFRINYGSLQLLEGNKGMTVEATIHFAFRADEKTLSPAKMEEILDFLMQNNNGVLSESTDKSDEDTEHFRYVFTFDLYKPVGEMKALSYDDMPDRYVFYDLPMQIIISKSLMFGDDFKIYFRAKDPETGETYYIPLKNVIYWEETPVASFESPVFVNEGIQKNLFVAKSWELKGQLILTNKSVMIKTLLRNTHCAPDFVYTICYEIGTLMYTAEAYFTMSNSGSVRKFVVSDFSFKLQGDYKVLTNEEKEIVLANIRSE